MANNQLDYILQQFVVNIDGVGKAGTGETCKPPVIEKNLESYRGGGMVAPRRHALGYKELSFSCELTSVDPQVIAQSALLVKKGVSFSVMGYLDGDNNVSHTAYLYMRGEAVKNDFGSWEAGKKSKMSIEFALDAVSMTIDGKVIFDIDIMNGVNAFDGTDVAAIIKAAIGA